VDVQSEHTDGHAGESERGDEETEDRVAHVSILSGAVIRVLLGRITMSK
jgi:hypothetical protein